MDLDAELDSLDKQLDTQAAATAAANAKVRQCKSRSYSS